MMSNEIQNTNLFDEICQIIDTTKIRIASTINNGITMMYWGIGNSINTHVLQNERAEYGKKIVATLSQQLSWSHLVVALPLKDELQRKFYLTMASSERWSRN